MRGKRCLRRLSAAVSTAVPVRFGCGLALFAVLVLGAPVVGADAPGNGTAHDVRPIDTSEGGQLWDAGVGLACVFSLLAGAIIGVSLWLVFGRNRQGRSRQRAAAVQARTRVPSAARLAVPDDSTPNALPDTEPAAPRADEIPAASPRPEQQAVARPAVVLLPVTLPLEPLRYRRKKRKSGIGLWLGLLAAGGVASAVFGGLLGWLAWQDAEIRSLGATTPQQIRLAELAAKGPGRNLHVSITRFEFGKEQEAVIQRNPSSGRWEQVWLPLYATDGGRDVKVLVKTANVKNDVELLDFRKRRELQGIITNPIEPLPAEEQAELRKSFPGVDLARVWILEEGRTVPTEARFAFRLTLAVVSVVLAVLCALRLRRALKKRTTAPDLLAP
jgi:hypothetical protein